MGENTANTALAERVREALESADPEHFADLLDPNVTWGAPDDPQPSCRNRRQVLQWYQRGRADGRRAEIHEISVRGDALVIAMTVHEGDSGEPSFDRWQVMKVANGRITDIRGYEEPPPLD